MLEALKAYDLEGLPISWTRFGSGHINETWLVVTGRPHLYILQKVNHFVFPDTDGLMRNIIRVTQHIRKKEPDPRRVLQLVPCRDGSLYQKLGDETWRMYEYITDSLCLDSAETDDDFRQSGVAFGTFQRQLADFPAEELVEVIPGFHDTPGRYRALRRAIEEDRAGRVQSCRAEIDFYLSRENTAGMMTGLLQKGELPLRVTLNDTKLNNVMLDAETRTPLCVIDLDTVMPGLAANDFGDAIRFGASTAAEDEKDLSKVHLSLPLYRAFAEGFLSACGESLTPLERATLPDGARLMTLECGVRFLTDYLEGDRYFHISRPEHNLDRTRTQMTLARDMEEREGDMRSIMEAI